MAVNSPLLNSSPPGARRFWRNVIVLSQSVIDAEKVSLLVWPDLQLQAHYCSSEPGRETIQA
jgi:hypothetical protein